VVALRGRRVLAVRQPQSGLTALPGGKVEPGEDPRGAAARELREETGIDLDPARLIDLATRIEAPGVTLIPFAITTPPPPRAAGELAWRWLPLGALAGRVLAPGFARSVHAALRTTARRPEPVPEPLFSWWASRRARLPWREQRDPYRVLVCEVMSQQTQIERVAQRWPGWMERWPTVAALADAALADVLREWQGLGYPRRARDLHAAARQIAAAGWPAAEELETLPGVGPYTADAIRCFALEHAVLPGDANVRRVLARRFPAGVGDRGRPWELGGALMDVGREHCRARPRCGGCPLRAGCMVAIGDPGWDPASRPRRQPAFAGSLRQRRGELLRAALAGERPAVSLDPRAAESLAADGLVSIEAGALVAPRPDGGTAATIVGAP